MKTVICGGGIIGCATAFYLTKKGHTDVTVVERFEIAGHSSGKAGGFLALDWNDHSPVGKLARKSFELHKSLGKELGTDIGFRELDTLSMVVHESGKASKKNDDDKVPKWIDGNVDQVNQIGSTSTTAQVHPKLLTDAFIQAAKKLGAKVVIGEVVGVAEEKDGAYRVKLASGEALEANNVVIAMGPWSDKARQWFAKSRLPAISGSRAHSIVLESGKADIGPHALFLSCNGRDPEIYPRPDGTVYICGMGDKEALPEDPAEIGAKRESCDTLRQVAGWVCSDLKEAKTVVQQACYLPISGDGMPIIGPLPDYTGVYMATGHSCWGILNGPATGLMLAEMIVDGKATSVASKPFEPSRFRR
jgi:glycine/D-amino acid oxidase-like deaminating enzyme